MIFVLISTSCLLFKDASISVDSVSNEPPFVEIFSPTTNDVLYVEELIPFGAGVSDTEDDPIDLTVVWSSDLDGILDQDWTPTEQGDSFGRATLSEGEHLLTVTVEDSEGLSTMEEVRVIVQGRNTAPTCDLFSPVYGATVAVGTTVEFRGTANDDHMLNENLEVEWHSNIVGVLGVSSPTDQGDVYYATTFESANTHFISMIVRDSSGQICVDDVEIHVANGPTVEILQPYDDDIVIVPYSNTVFEGVITHDEIDVSTLSVQWVSDVDGELISGNPSSDGEALWVAEFESYGPHQVVLKTEDDNGLVGSDSVSIIYNAIPKISDVLMDPQMPSTSDVLTCEPIYNDEDGGPLSVEYIWSFPRSGQSIQATTANNVKSTLDLQTVVLAESETIECYVVVLDEYGYTAEMGTWVRLSN